ncbi:hypothetical protein PM082_004391 [Marasmius tenuissimus]|nr:hypothetical protein PM082_004391 [Marasmius tenuissimus]
MALGRFNPNRSARLVLWELKLIIDFPSGQLSSFHPPSSLIQTPESLKYTAGAIFCWAKNRGMTEGELKEFDLNAWLEMKDHKKGAASEYIQLYSTLEELLVHADST